MKMARQLVIAGLVALFAIGTMVHAASATTMAAEMAMADIQLDGSGSCQACPDDSNASPLCDLICLTTFVALPTSLEIERAVTHTVFTRSPDQGTIGQFGSPDPAPPKLIIQV
jgi:hypothetical protein